MSRRRTRLRLATTAIIALALSPLVESRSHAASSAATDRTASDHKVDVVYGLKHGVALMMDVYSPKQDANDAHAVFVVSSGWFSAHEIIVPAAPMFVDE